MFVIKFLSKDEKLKLANLSHKRALMWHAVKTQRDIAVGNDWFSIANTLQTTMDELQEGINQIQRILANAK